MDALAFRGRITYAVTAALEIKEVGIGNDTFQFSCAGGLLPSP